MKRAYVVVEGRLDADFLRKVLSVKAQENIGIVEAGGRNGISSMARSLLVTRRVPVAALMDADSPDSSVAEESRRSMEELIQLVASPDYAKVFAVVPGLESLFFEVPGAIERQLGYAPPEVFISLGKRDPKAVLDILAKEKNRIWDSQAAIQALTPEESARLRSTGTIGDLNRFLESLEVKQLAA